MEAVGDRYNAPLEYLQPTSAGIDGLPAWFLRVAAPIFCKTIAYLINMSLVTSARGLHQLLACDLVQNLVYLVQLHHCTKALYAYVTYATMPDMSALFADVNVMMSASRNARSNGKAVVSVKRFFQNTSNFKPKLIVLLRK